MQPMALKPTRKAVWATEDEFDPVTGKPNKETPTPELELSGIKRRQPWPRAIMNEQFNNIGNWLEWLEEEVDGTGSATLESAYPVGSVYINASITTNPAVFFNFGTWVAISQGRMLVGLDSGDSDFDTIGEEGGSYTHAHGDNFVSHPHQLTEWEMPAHNHEVSDYPESGSPVDSSVDITSGSPSGGLRLKETSYTGGTDAHSHDLTGFVGTTKVSPPYHVVVFWKRTA